MLCISQFPAGHCQVQKGDEGDDSLYGNDGADNLHGGSGDDHLDAGNGITGQWNRLYGDGGNDTLLGGSGQDSIDGGTGDDSIITSGKCADTPGCQSIDSAAECHSMRLAVGFGTAYSMQTISSTSYPAGCYWRRYSSSSGRLYFNNGQSLEDNWISYQSPKERLSSLSILMLQKH